MGKSTSGSFLAGKGIPVIDTDALATDESRIGSEGFAEIVEAFGPGILSSDGSLDRRRLADLVFFDSAALRRLEAILHPRIARRWRDQVAACRRTGAAQVAVLIPLLFERQYESDFNCTLGIACSTKTQRSRLLGRGWSESQINARNAAQMSVAEKMSRARFVVWTEGSLASHMAQLDRILGEISAT